MLVQAFRIAELIEFWIEVRVIQTMVVCHPVGERDSVFLDDRRISATVIRVDSILAHRLRFPMPYIGSTTARLRREIAIPTRTNRTASLAKSSSTEVKAQGTQHDKDCTITAGCVSIFALNGWLLALLPVLAPELLCQNL